MSQYEQHALQEIHAWKNPEIGWFGQAMKVISQPLDAAGDALFKAPVVGDAIQKAIQGLMGLCNDAAQWTVRPEAIFEDFRTAGHTHVHSHEDVVSLDLSEVDRVVGYLALKYKGIALVEGAGAGAAGVAGLAIDIPTLLTLNLRAIGEYAAHYGFDCSLQQEKLFAFNVLALASSPTDASKAAAMAQLVRIARDVAKQKTWKDLEKSVFVKIIQEISKALGVRLTKAKLSQMLPVVGAVVGAGFNAYFTSKVCDAAYFLYRERFLGGKFGPTVIDMPVEPAPDLDPHYQEAEQPI